MPVRRVVSAGPAAPAPTARAVPDPPAADAIILAGGRGTRMGGIDKPAIVIGGQTLLAAALAATAACAHVVVVGPGRAHLPGDVLTAQEDPPGAGPVAALAAGLAGLPAGTDFVVTLAADLPFIGAPAITALLSACARAPSGFACARDTSGRPQYLVAAWRRSVLDAAINELGALENQPMKALIPTGARLLELPGISDVDTENDVRAALRTATGSRRSLSEARDALRASLSPIAAGTKPLQASVAAALAGPLRAATALPRFDVAAMDGYAVAGPGPWTVRQDVGYAGGARPEGLLPADAVRITTGAHVPAGTTQVVRDEYVQATSDQLRLRPDAPHRNDMRRAGEDFAPGDVIAEAGTVVTPALISAALSVEVTTASVRGPLRARAVLTGDEIRAQGPLRAGQTRDSIGPVLADFLSGTGIQLLGHTHLRDTGHSFDGLFADPGDAELLLVVGATGGGAADNLRPALARAGADFIVDRLALKPGGSAVVAKIPSGPVVFGLPGNPFAAVAVLLALGPALAAALTGGTVAAPALAPVANAGSVSGPVPRIVPARPSLDGSWAAAATTRTAHLAGLIGYPALALVPAHASDGDLAELVPLS